MKLPLILAGVALLGAQLSPAVANAAPRTYSYAVTHPRYGVIGTYDRTMSDANGLARAQSRLRVTVKILGVVVHRENADQTEAWDGTRLISFDSITTTNGRRIEVRGEARDNGFQVTSPKGTQTAPANVVASDPWSLNHMGPGVVVSIKSGKIDPVNVTGGEADAVTFRGVSTPARHFHVRTATQPNKWEVWIDQQGVPIKFRSLESSGAIDFNLVSPASQARGGANRVALGESPSSSDVR
ncbi:MAG: hypothetical protein JWR43_372 [Phenylobacterium sp.]|jgi:hypothetical protein|nr:hypothetical protein [Phenylobacterium sp.]